MVFEKSSLDIALAILKIPDSEIKSLASEWMCKN